MVKHQLFIKMLIDKGKIMEIKEIIKELQTLENYGRVSYATKETFNKTKKYFGKMPEDLQKFYKIYNGGLFFGHYFACVGEETYSFKNLNAIEFKKMYNIPQNVVVFCDTGYGDYVGYDTKNKKFIQINPEEEEENWQIFNKFTDFLNEFLEISKELIEDGTFEPLR